MKKFCKCFVFLFFINILISPFAFAEKVSEVASLPDNGINAKAAVLMEASTGEILFEMNKDEKLPIASVTKTMTMLLIMEALDSGKISLNDMVTTSEYANSMGGSQVYLEVGEKMSVSDMLKGIAVSSGNDCAVAMAEFISGTEPAFVELMNKRADEIGAKNTHFINCNGLDETSDHHSTALDVAIISRELLKHPKIQDFLTIWMDTLRDGKFGLSNTNRLIKFYPGANGIKTGSTNIAQFCLSAAAKRDNMQLIAVVLGAPTSSDRFSSASKLLDFGFANFMLVDNSIILEPLPDIKVSKGTKDAVKLAADSNVNFVVKKGDKSKIKYEINTANSASAPIYKDAKLGEIVFSLDDAEIARRDLVASEDVPRVTFLNMLIKLARKIVEL
jgi:D-alanyl-D-alanine carboxypeptidase (penicillin-binding protein 5/6)